jgi:hypothetical protein
MKQNKLTAALLAGMLGVAGISGSAQAVNINPDGLGQVLFYPYYTTNGNNTTLISVVNTTDNAKAVKVRFMESQNSKEVLDFNLYLSAHDVWAAAVTDVDGVPTLITNDTTCSSPYLFEDNGGIQPFLPWAMNDMGGATIEELELESYRMSEGHIEIIEMGTVVGDSALAVTHVRYEDGDFPADCDSINEAWTNRDGTANDGYWITDPSVDMLPPSGGLFGGASIVNVADGTLYGYDATAIAGWATKLEGNDFLHQVPGTVLPSLNSGDVKTGTVFLDDGTTLTSPEFLRGVDAVSFVLMHNNLMNEYNVEENLSAGTEWAITFPTKSFYVDTAVSGVVGALPPFTAAWDSVKGGACETVLIDSVYNREEQTYEVAVGEPLPPLYSPMPPAVAVGEPVPDLPFDLCWETNVIQFGTITDQPSEILGSNNVVYLDPEALDFSNGWMNLNMDDYVVGDEDKSRDGLGGLEGLPVVGFSISRFSNGFLTNDVGDNVLANYGGIFRHKATRKISSDVVR